MLKTKQIAVASSYITCESVVTSFQLLAALSLCSYSYVIYVLQARYLSTFGSSTLTDTVASMMKAVMSHELSLQYNWVGTRGKHSFQHLKLSATICGN